MNDSKAQGAPNSAHDLSDALTAALAAASGRVNGRQDAAYLRALEMAKSARTDREILDALHAARAVRG